MNGLLHLTQHADTFVITCNVDGHFARAGFNENHVLETEGSIRTSVDERRLAHPDVLAIAQLEELARLVQVHCNHKVVILELGAEGSDPNASNKPAADDKPAAATPHTGDGNAPIIAIVALLIAAGALFASALRMQKR